MRKAVGNKIRFFRERLGISQDALAMDVGVSKTTISLTETGKSWPQYDNLEAIATRLGVTVAAFFDDVRPEIRPTVDEALEVIRQALAGRVQPHAPETTVATRPAQAGTTPNPGGEFQDVLDALKRNPKRVVGVRDLLGLNQVEDLSESTDHAPDHLPKDRKPR